MDYCLLFGTVNELWLCLYMYACMSDLAQQCMLSSARVPVFMPLLPLSCLVSPWMNVITVCLGIVSVSFIAGVLPITSRWLAVGRLSLIL